MTNTPKKLFFHYHQNNSGGSFDYDNERGIGENVWIEADDATQANAIAERIGLYWNGCEKGMDCECCGDRWHPAWEHVGKEAPDTKGYYAECAYVHYADGRIVKLEYTMNKSDMVAELEAMVDKTSLMNVLLALEIMCHEKAAHIKAN